MKGGGPDRDGANEAKDETEEAEVKSEKKSTLATASGGAIAEDKTATSVLERSGIVGFVGRNVRLVASVGWLIIAGISSIQGPAFVVLILAAGALILTISFFWSSVRTVLGETPLSGADAYVLAAPRAEEEQKQAVLRALKDLEFERSVGKISDDDYAALVAKYRGEAKRLLRAIEEDAKPRRDRVEKLVHARLVAAGLETSPDTYRSVADIDEEADEGRNAAPQKPLKEGRSRKKKPRIAEPLPERTVTIEPIEDTSSAAPAKKNTDSTWKSVSTLKTKESPTFAPVSRKCIECGTRNDTDAVFCKKCGSKKFASGSKAPPVVKTEDRSQFASSERGDDTEKNGTETSGDGEADAADTEAGVDANEETEKEGDLANDDRPSAEAKS